MKHLQKAEVKLHIIDARWRPIRHPVLMLLEIHFASVSKQHTKAANTEARDRTIRFILARIRSFAFHALLYYINRYSNSDFFQHIPL
jgi:hypothetical protein